MTERTNCGTRAGPRGGRASNQVSDASTNPIVSTMIALTSASILLKRLMIGLIVALGLFYGSDYLYLRIRILHPKPANPSESPKSLRFLPIPDKNRRTGYQQTP